MTNSLAFKVNNRTMPECSVIPILAYRDFAAAVPWLCDTFGFKERWIAAGHRAQLSFGNSTIVITEQSAERSAGQYSLLVRVADVQAHFEYTRAKGASVVQMPEYFSYGELQYTVSDIEGNSWTFSESVKDVMPEHWGGVSRNL